ncbi:hypothetical protein ROZALSC1DRAFT_31413, partial [Rozella allomycis CSF55]
MDALVSAISASKYDLKEMETDNSPFIDFAAKEFQSFFSKLNPLKKDYLVHKLYEQLGDCLSQIVSWCMVEGFSRIKKCTNEGRACMQLDANLLLATIEKLSERKYANHQIFVQEYIKAYYLQEHEVENWVKSHRTIYTIKQLSQLVQLLMQAIPSSNKKLRLKYQQ